MTKRQIKILMPWLKGGIITVSLVGLLYGCSQLDYRTPWERFEGWDQAFARVQRADKRSECVINIEFRASAQAKPITIQAVDGRCSWLLVKPIPDDMKSK